MRKVTHKIEFERLCHHFVRCLCVHPDRCLKGQRWSTVAASVVSTGAIRPSVHPPDEAPAGLSLSSQRVRLLLITSTQKVRATKLLGSFFLICAPDCD